MNYARWIHYAKKSFLMVYVGEHDKIMSYENVMRISK